MAHPALSPITNPKLAIVDQLFALLDRHPDLWQAVSGLARSKDFFLTDQLDERVKAALELVERQIGETDDVRRIKAALAS
ncbi:MAG: hypothetical protein KatS3mg082_2616 [Nitrospiraceae bacterium]|nr:MAG: hypothetical protein KatS3mg082_2616 [Nitrospiraceae bacterium]